jgi:2-dehydropantoate 2-reductase
MRIVMIGAGAMGGVFGARFARAGADIVLYDHDAEHVAAIKETGLYVSTPTGDIHLPIPAMTEIGTVGPVDGAVVLVDSNATTAAAIAAARVVPADGFVLTLQNGIGNIEALTAVLGEERVLAGSTYNSAAKLAPGRVIHSNVGETVIGKPDGRGSAHIAAMAELFSRADLPIATSNNVLGHVWMKFVLNVAINPVAAMTGLRPGEIMRSPAARKLLEHVLDEALAVVAAKGVRLSEADPRAAVLDHAYERYNRPSMLQHVEQGRRTEVEALNGALLREAAAFGLACPFNEALVLAIRSIDGRGAARSIDEAALEAAARATPRRL